MDVRRILGPGLAILLAVGVGTAIWWSGRDKSARDQAEASAAAVQPLSVISGSESVPFLSDERVQAVLLKHGLRITVQKSGSREMALRTDLKQFDAAFPGGTPAAEKIKALTGARQTVSTFYTPMVVASWKPLIPVLEANGLVKKKGEAWYLIDMPRLFAMMDRGTRWRELKDNTVFAVGKSVLVATTDARKSNSAAQYLALASYVANDGNVVVTDADVDKVMPRILPLFLKQGYQENTSSGPFENYLSMGMGAVPLVMIYESQFLEQQLRSTQINADMVLLYPEPTVYSKRVVVPMNSRGERFAQLLQTDAELSALAAEYGMRSANPAPLAAALAAKKLPAPPQLTDVVDAPTFEALEKMIARIETELK